MRVYGVHNEAQVVFAGDDSKDVISCERCGKRENRIVGGRLECGVCGNPLYAKAEKGKKKGKKEEAVSSPSPTPEHV